ncbi:MULTISPECIES: hypothetical protein [unclassified Bradyrhizobium]|uniref:hypothetical protein n=1 Tax=unclassified Bradyrhizobium TaxID=2631580 RepID=UPI001CD2C994|nr:MULTISPECIES: hypothetical protein [unclassified Bradyrhizobium]MCA1386040.1 hypothetical protein [Bradyrhizobium sp. BRP05]MCA1393838.1 hypothetical protein [Bradyrhizobium sp. IC3123]MCA1423482.1 hypothetical protein [Bradyrhizobium sp. BRP23]MCA1430624.1 hypothetical protein [Bradyrhizobium sp. NBAIM16]MCA1480135.1 hypothetical protein [Bradyrhizobium sp. NBAIM08]
MTSYIVRITAENVPPDLAGAPIAVEVFSEAGKAERAALRLAGRPTDVGVPGPGSYLVRTALPSGRIISITVATPETGTNGLAIGEAVLDMKETDAIADFWREAESLMKIATAIQASRKPGETMPPWLGERLRELGNRALENIAELGRNALTRLLDRFRGQVVITDVSSADPGSPRIQNSEHRRTAHDAHAGSPIELSYRWGTFVEWTPGRTHSTLVLRKGGDGKVDAQGEISVPSGIAPTNCFYVEISEPSSHNAALVVWLPGPKGEAVKLAASSELAAYRSGSVLSAYPASPEDALATTLYEYVRQGAMERARLFLDDLIERLRNPQDMPSSNTSILAAYVLYKLRHPYADELIPRLREMNPDLPDVHVLQCAQWIATGKQDSVPDELVTAIKCGIPIYTEGVRLLRDSSNLCRDLFPDDKRFGDHVRKAHSAASAANFESMLTCLRLGADVMAEFV